MAKQVEREITDAEIEAFLAKKKAKEAADKAAKKAEKSTFMSAKEAREKFPVALHEATIKDGCRKLAPGTKVEVHHVGAYRGQPSAYVRNVGGTPIMDGKKDMGWVHPKFLKPGKEMSDARKAAIAAERGEREGAIDPSETLILPCRVVDESREKSILLQYSGWFGAHSFPKSLVERVGETEDGLGVFEVPAWRVKQAVGMDALERLREKQGDFAKLVD